MAKKRKSPTQAGPPKRGARGSADSITVRRVGGRKTIFELVYPASVRQRKADMDEIREMLQAGEIDVAVDELRWLLGGCRELLEAHKLLGEIAANENDLPLAKEHLAGAYQLGRAAVGKKKLAGTLPYSRPANRAFLEAGKGLAACLIAMDQTRDAAEVVEELLVLDPADPLDARKLITEARRR